MKKCPIMIEDSECPGEATHPVAVYAVEPKEKLETLHVCAHHYQEWFVSPRLRFSVKVDPKTHEG